MPDRFHYMYSLIIVDDCDGEKSAIRLVCNTDIFRVSAWSSNIDFCA